jgi:DNA-binding Lrp family transcriptional regulator
MIKDILRLMSKGNLTIVEIAQKLNISKDELLNRFKMMEQMGYLEQSKKTTNENISHESDRMCAFCPEAKSCSKNDITSNDGLTYRLTEKGKRVSGV